MNDAASTQTPLAALDLGSNSFHLLAARLVGGEPVLVDRLREQVQLGAGLDEEMNLTREAQDRALACLERFGERVRAIPEGHVRIVGTNTLRNATNASEFIEEAEEALGHPIEILSGYEEARLIYLGVSHSSAQPEGNRLVVDIGGGSTECILGVKFEPHYFQSLEMGCITFSRRFFGGGEIGAKQFEEAELAASLELRRHKRKFREKGWKSAIGASGTIRAVQEVLSANEWNGDAINPKGLSRLKKRMIERGHAESLDFPGLKAERAPVFAGGVAILSAVFQSLGIDRMEASSGALREGVLYDLLGRLRHEDVRDRTIRGFEERYHVDTRQANRVEGTALDAFDQVADGWKLDRLEARRALGWAARLHEVGLAVSYERHHRHGAYLIANSDMQGFSRDAQVFLATLVEAHRRRIRRSTFKDLAERDQKLTRRLAVLLRLAVRLHRARDADVQPEFRLEADGDDLVVRCDREWIEGNPLTRRDLEREAEWVAPLDIRMRVEIDEP